MGWSERYGRDRREPSRSWHGIRNEWTRVFNVLFGSLDLDAPVFQSLPPATTATAANAADAATIPSIGIPDFLPILLVPHSAVPIPILPVFISTTGFSAAHVPLYTFSIPGSIAFHERFPAAAGLFAVWSESDGNGNATCKWEQRVL